MPKMKTRKGMAKRIRVTRNGKLMRDHPYKSHLMTKKSGKRKRHFKADNQISPADATEVRRALGI